MADSSGQTKPGDTSGLPDEAIDPETGKIICGIYFDCKCDYDSIESTCGNWRGWEETIDDCVNDPELKALLDGGFCRTILSALQGDCVNEGDVMTISWTSVWHNENGDVPSPPVEKPDCQSGNVDFPCPEKSALRFFSWVNFLIAWIFAAIGYFVFGNVK